MPVYIIYALLAALCFSLNAIFLKIASKYSIKNIYAFQFYFFLTSLIFLPIIFIFTKIQSPLSGLGFILMTNVAFFIGNLLILKILSGFDISILHPFFHFQTIFSVGFAYLLLGERFPGITYFWIILIIIGGLLIGSTEKIKLKIFVSKRFLIFTVAILCYALSDVTAKQSMEYIDFYNLKFYNTIILFLMSLIFLPLAKSNLRISIKKLLPVGISSFFSFTAIIFLLAAFSYNITISQPIGMMGSLFTLIVTFFLSQVKPQFLENQSTKIYLIRLIGVILMIFSAVMLTNSL